jgi:hypothetical protein
MAAKAKDCGCDPVTCGTANPGPHVRDRLPCCASCTH